MHSRKPISAGWIALCGVAACALSATPASANQTLNYTVQSTAQPWQFVNGGLNTTFQYGNSDGTAPTVVSGADGFDFTAGDTFTVTALSGLVSAFGGTPFSDAGGDTGYDASDGGGSSGNYFPSKYISPATYPVYLAALVGTFADGSGSIVGTPFLLGNGPTSEIVPVGAKQLQLGIDDDIFSDNSGSFTVSVTGPKSAPPAVPEPGALSLLGLGLLPLALAARRRANRPA